MKKLLMIGAILALGTTMAYGATTKGDDGKASADVKVIADIVAENLVITDLNGEEIILDFGKVSQLQRSGVSNAHEGYKVTYLGDNISNGKLKMELKGQDVSGNDGGAKEVMMKYQGSVAAGEKPDKFTSVVALAEYEATMPTDKVYVGMINGTIDHATTKVYVNGATEATTGFYNNGNDGNLIDNGEYIGTLELEVTLASN